MAATQPSPFSPVNQKLKSGMAHTLAAEPGYSHVQNQLGLHSEILSLNKQHSSYPVCPGLGVEVAQCYWALKHGQVKQRGELGRNSFLRKEPSQRWGAREQDSKREEVGFCQPRAQQAHPQRSDTIPLSASLIIY